MATDIQLTDLTNGTNVNGTWEGTGVFDVLIKAVNANINIQYEASRIKDSDYATVYLGSLQSVISQSMEYLFKEKLTEAQVDQTLKATTNLENQDLLTLAQIGKVKIEADVASALGSKEVDIKEAQLSQIVEEIKVVAQKVVGRKQSLVNKE